MIQQQTVLQVADNSGAKEVMCIKVLGSSKRRYATLGDEIIVSVKKASPKGAVKQKTIQRAVIVRTNKNYKRKDGSYVRFDENAVVLVDKAGKKEPLANRVFGPIPREVIERGYQKIGSLAPEIV